MEDLRQLGERLAREQRRRRFTARLLKIGGAAVLLGLMVAAPFLWAPRGQRTAAIAPDANSQSTPATATPPSPDAGASATPSVGAPAASLATPVEPSATAAPAPVEGPLRLGMNLANVVDWLTEWPFVDVFKHSRIWMSENAGPEGGENPNPVEVDELGWPILKPGQAAATLMCREIDGRYPAGKYVCTYEGDGELAFQFDAEVLSAKGKRIELSVTPGDGGIGLRIVRSNPADRVRNIRVWMPGFENAKSPFHPLFKEKLRSFKALRFMDWGATNNSKLRNWSERTTPTSARQSGPNGVAVEYMVDLCNEMNVAPWFCMPHLADDEFVREFATLVKARLKPDLRMYVEWSNETWNGIFEQTDWLNAEAKRRGVEIAAQVGADEALRDWKIWHEVFGADRGRVVRVAAGMQYNPWTCEQMLLRLNGEFDAVSCTSYFYTEEEDQKRFTAATTSRDILKSSLKNLVERGLPLVAEHKKLADDWSKRLGRKIEFVIYEGGQHLTGEFGQESPYSKALIAAQSDPGMYDVYARMLSGCQANGVDLFMAFSYCGKPSKWGSWGHLEYQDQSPAAAPKFRALVDGAEGRLPTLAP